MTLDRNSSQPRRADRSAWLARLGVLTLLVAATAASATENSAGFIGPPAPVAAPVEFEVGETLMLPRQSGVSLVLEPREDALMFVEYGTGGGSFEHATPVETVLARHGARFELDGLKAGGSYAYRVLCKPSALHGPFVPRDEHAFRTLPSPGAVFSFAYTTDSHAYAQWAQDAFSGSGQGDASYELLQKGLGNLAVDDLHFFVIGGDWAMLDAQGAKGGTVDGVVYPPGVIADLATARQRYRKIFSTEIYGQVTPSLPFIYVLGNHEGEEGFVEGIDSCESYEPEVKAWGETARLSLLDNPGLIYGGDRHGRYYSFDAGDALVVVIDVMGEQNVLPESAEDWSLSLKQYTWLESVISASTQKWKFVFAEHFAGGEGGPTSEGACYYYGRGSIKATDTNKITGDLKGGVYGQGAIQSLLAANLAPGGAAFFCSGHDHVAMGPNEKPDKDGTGTRVFYTTGGTFGAGAPWTVDESFQKEMDLDGDSKADFYSDVNGSIKRGYFRITVNGPQSVSFAYVQSSTDAGNDRIVYSKTILAD
jgi:hypothetical protein